MGAPDLGTRLVEERMRKGQRRRANGEGSIYQTKSGLWRGAVVYADLKTGAWRRKYVAATKWTYRLSSTFANATSDSPATTITKARATHDPARLYAALIGSAGTRPRSITAIQSQAAAS
jgi:hypothetical protein